MSAHDSTSLASAIARDDVDYDATRDILFRFFGANKPSIWRDALEEHGLL
jgi:hypothetical protein